MLSLRLSLWLIIMETIIIKHSCSKLILNFNWLPSGFYPDIFCFYCLNQIKPKNVIAYKLWGLFLWKILHVTAVIWQKWVITRKEPDSFSLYICQSHKRQCTLRVFSCKHFTYQLTWVQNIYESAWLFLVTPTE